MSKILSNLSKPITGLDGKTIVEVDGRTTVSAGKLIANALAGGQSSEPARAMDVALKIYNASNEITLEEADFAMVKDAIDKNQGFSNLAKAAVLEVLNGAKDK